MNGSSSTGSGGKFGGGRSFGSGGGRFGGERGGGGRFGGNGNGRFGGYGGGNSFKDKQAGGGLKKPTWDFESLSPFAKDFYNSHPNVVNRPFHEVENFLASKEITIRGKAPKPIQFFEEANFPEYVMAEVRWVGNNYTTFQMYNNFMR